MPHHSRPQLLSTFALSLLLAACGSAPLTPTPPAPSIVTATPAPVATSVATPTPAHPLAGVRGIVDPGNLAWPRTVEGKNGPMVIPAKPQRIVTLSVGHDEITYALVSASRVVAVGSATKIAAYSNVADLAKGAATVSREPETVLAQKPDVMVTSPYVSQDLVATLTRAGLPVLVTDGLNTPEGRIEQVLLLGYIYGEETRAVAFAQELRSRMDVIHAVIKGKPPAARPRVAALAFYGDKIYVAGIASTEGGIVEAAGGINPAAEQGLKGNVVISLEGVIALRPDVIVVTQPGESSVQFRQALLSNPALAEVPAIRDGRIFVVENRLFTTLSHYNLRGTEELAKMLWPQELGTATFASFSTPP